MVRRLPVFTRALTKRADSDRKPLTATPHRDDRKQCEG
jgi:hypothetical protein